MDYATQLGYGVKLLAIAERLESDGEPGGSLPLAVRVQPTLVPRITPLPGSTA